MLTGVCKKKLSWRRRSIPDHRRRAIFLDATSSSLSQRPELLRYDQKLQFALSGWGRSYRTVCTSTIFAPTSRSLETPVQCLCRKYVTEPIPHSRAIVTAVFFMYHNDYPLRVAVLQYYSSCGCHFGTDDQDVGLYGEDDFVRQLWLSGQHNMVGFAATCLGDSERGRPSPRGGGSDRKSVVW